MRRRATGRPRACARRAPGRAPTARGGTCSPPMKRRAARQAGRHRLRDRRSAAVFQSPSAAEAVAVGHQALHGEARQLGQAAEVFERVGERPIAARGRGTPAGRPRCEPRP